MKITVVGGGWAGVSAALQAAINGAQVTLLERTDMLLGTGLVGGIMRNNGRYTACEEMIAMGGGTLFTLCDRHSRHRGVTFPGHHHAALYDVMKMPHAVEILLKERGVDIYYERRVIKADMWGDVMDCITDDRGHRHIADVYIDTTGTAGPMANCIHHGRGCAMCVLRCPSFGGRASLTALAGIEEMQAEGEDGAVGAMSGSCKIHKETLAPELLAKLENDGAILVPIPKGLAEDHLSEKACQQYALPEYAENLVLLDTGHAKLMHPFFPLQKLRQVPGMERAVYADPCTGGRGNSMRYFAMAPRENTMAVKGVQNLFCAGEKAGPLVGHTEAIVTGTLAGYNAVRCARNREMLTLPIDLCCGDAIAQVGRAMECGYPLGQKYTFSGSVYFQRMRERGLYTTDREEIAARVNKTGLTDVFA